MFGDQLADKQNWNNPLTPHLVSGLAKRGRQITKIDCASGYNIALTQKGILPVLSSYYIFNC